MGGRTLVNMCAALLVLVPTAVRAQEGAIAGLARDQSEAVLPGVTVELIGDTTPDIKAMGITDDAGRFVFPGVPPGDYHLVIEDETHEAAVVAVPGMSSGSCFIEIDLIGEKK